MSLAVATRTDPLAWRAAFEEDPRIVATAVEILEEQRRARR